MDIYLKPSMFNRLINTCNGVVLYNSYIGVDSIIELSGDDAKTANEMLSSTYIILDDKNGKLKSKLVERGYLVPSDIDEKSRRERLMIETIFSNDLRLIIHTTENCNFRCEYCALDFHKKDLDLSTQDRIIKFIRKNIRFYNRVIIDWFGGEPLLNIAAIERISREVKECCHKAHKQYVASITTNGYLLSPTNVNRLYNANVYKICVTIDGIKETHNRQRHLLNGMPTFDRIIENLKSIRDNKSLSLDVIIRTNISLEISQILDEYYKYYNELFGHDKRFSLFVRLVGNWGGSRVDAFKPSIINRSSYKDIYHRFINYCGNISFRNNYSDLEPAGCACGAMYKNKYTIDVSGNVHKCDTPMESGKIGYIDESGKMVLDEDMHYKWISPYGDKPKECDDCFFSCSCFMLTCPKKRALDKNNQCEDFIAGIDELILLCNNNIKRGKHK